MFLKEDYDDGKIRMQAHWPCKMMTCGKLHETHKPLNDKSGLSFSFGERSSEGTSTLSDLASDKFKKMNFVKASVIHDAYESVKYDDQTTGQLNHKSKSGIGYIKPDNSKPSWLTNRLEKDKAKAGPKSSVPNQQRSERFGNSIFRFRSDPSLSDENGPSFEQNPFRLEDQMSTLSGESQRFGLTAGVVAQNSCCYCKRFVQLWGNAGRSVGCVGRQLERDMMR
ncbi:hypothetical protein F511_20792 [Dorcoceras hygrometricum]|uniref:Uncharacterized protein n=1 Tax=Dorcoceras hygrometricum TaxID=472368 RepID=A0A2Z7CYW5_9LAMI|nr:hypothetical protein F511_20792 [Dorcoceras hygrometricum]